MNKLATRQEALAKFADGQTIMIGGFLGVGTPESLVDGLVELNVKNLTIIANDTAFVGKGIGKLVVNKQAKKVIVSHIGTNPETGRQMNAGELEVELVPQGTLAERIRSAGAGLGGILTPTGIGTIVEKGKEKITVNGKTYLLETPLRADIALIKAAKADTFGNLVYNRAARNFNPLMAMAADLVIVEAEEIVDVGSLDPDEIMTPGIFVDMIIKG
ncbi:MAG: branched-chain amino acid dehydrogenase [Peptococcaceae bacterium]|jgi:acetate CoA/acetoacetate CoA-transferase alpha subunit|nr:branched-chain amino acid dehydrogenase [Peptococcaceae bacterium]